MFFLLKRIGNTFFYTLIWIIDSFSIIAGLWHVFRLRPPRVTFFGGAKLKLDDPYAKAAEALASILVQHDISIITGGGGGIMEAAAIGAQKIRKDGKSMINNLGISVSGLEEGATPLIYSSFVRIKDFVMRKWLMIHFSSAYIIFPGGVGTYDELAEILTLMDTGKLKGNPIVLYGKEYWKKLEVWVDDGLQRGFIHPHVKEFFIIADDVQTAFSFICNSCACDGYKII
ncbi:TPA: TIGR00730 family Rossman fold protein [Candidatus Dependentiae bacterium]|nr:MAG: hypothetical protein US03_C0002G0053 [candidate division TM6 bacterium GW2011_GWF2_36_131]KKQ03487.1 MAG: hypothetical protein US13_C0002G0053 [candidate division TM6 bacterium GW2011_GWE2_36_25]KKQ20239.1 MAG: hypothetical protein US32_C0001G0136 [candidate division TM6 bacterium GW2011_GWA2_36_9]HBR70778.1 TIGR00730 family Rossman fold protein [Candidatus Dependentiae bacterium]HCU00163.1 TIGR00730 family Rossman fold protein [Candidatus Dependentiae bacterium]